MIFPVSPSSLIDQDVYEIEDILDHRGSTGNYEFLIKWKNFPISEASWVPSNNIHDSSCVKNYWAKQEFNTHKPKLKSILRNSKTLRQKKSSSSS
jgi:hypothetical protein